MIEEWWERVWDQFGDDWSENEGWRLKRVAFLDVLNAHRSKHNVFMLLRSKVRYLNGIAWYNTHLSTAENKNFYNHAITKTRSIMQFKRFGCEFLSLKRALTEPPPKPICKNTYIPLNVSHKMPKVLPLRCPSLYSHTQNLRTKGKC